MVKSFKQDLVKLVSVAMSAYADETASLVITLAASHALEVLE
jgi:hypothetical protein